MSPSGAPRPARLPRLSRPARPCSPPLLLFLALAVAVPALAAPSGDGSTEILSVSAKGKIGSASNITCIFVPPDAQIEWTFNKAPLVTNDTRFEIENERGTNFTPDQNMMYFQRFSIIIPKTVPDDHGVYGCNIVGHSEIERSAHLNLSFPTRVTYHTESPVKVKISNRTTLSCVFEGFNLTDIKWRKLINGSLEKISNYDKLVKSNKINDTHVNITLTIDSIVKDNNGTYVCGTRDPYSRLVSKESINLLVLDKPNINLDFVKAIDSKRIYLNWTLNDGNSPVKEFTLQYIKKGSETWMFYQSPIKGGNVSFVMKGLEPSSSYRLKINARNDIGVGFFIDNHNWITTLSEDPVFVPLVTVKGFTTTSMTIGWNAPPEPLSEYVHYYELIAKEKNSRAEGKEAVHSGDSRNHPYMFDNLKPDTTYIFTVRACSEFTSECGEWSDPVNGTTMDGTSGPPIITSLVCKNDNISGTNFVFVAWKPPIQANGKIIRYNVRVSGSASYVNGIGTVETTTWGPKTKTTTTETQTARFDTMPANTNFTVSVTAVTRTKREGEIAQMQCMTPPSTPPRDSLQGIRWIKVREGNGRWLFQLNIPRVTERNGAICCYRIFLVRMKNKQKLNDMPSPEHLHISSYEKVHNGKNGAGAYIAEIFTSDTLESNVILGDGITYITSNANSLKQCAQCASVLPNKAQVETTTPIPTTSTHSSTTSDIIKFTTPINLDTLETTVMTDTETTEIIKILEKPINNTPPAVDSLRREDSNTSTSENPESNKSLHSKKKLKMKRQDPTLEEKLHFQKQYDHRKEHESFDGISTIDEEEFMLNDDQRYALNSDFYAKKRISHQNKRPYNYVSNYNIDAEDSVRNEDLPDLENDDTVFPQNDDFMYKHYMEDYTNDKFVKGHKIVAREIISEEFEKKMKDLVEPHTDDNENDDDYDSDKDGTDDDKNSFKRHENEKLEEIVDIKKEPDEDLMAIFDGQLDIDSNYTGFLELLVHPGNEEKMVPMYSDYFSVLKPGPNNAENSESDVYELIIKIAIGCVLFVLLLLIIFCVFHNHAGRKARQRGVEMNTLQHTLRNLYQGLKGGRHQLVSHSPPDMPPISKENLLAAYTERQADTGYGFQVEFEMLPDCFPDRTMEASEAKENQNKNRYPDIKAYDQTRVKLSQIDSVVGSDYINANIVMGYKERKKFICAQGPTDVTVDDFWRMIWEYNLELVVMLTNLEEYSKVKCSKYWPDQNQQDKMFNNISVHHVSEKRYSDYIIRELKITKQSLSTSNSNNQIIEANGVPKRNGVSEGSNGISSPNGTQEERIVHQYHFLMWKDFVAPEYPYAILKFIKRMNEACTAGRPILVHCSAGVGRTGTLVALDCLLQQLSAESQVAVFNTVCDLRRQRNFLVQSLKQYVFVYRALVEYAQYEDTEISASKLKSTVDRLRQTAENSDTCLMEEEFEKLKQPILEMIKPSAAGRAPEHLAKNRNEAVIPYDHNRVILAPIATKENSTYINATFIEGYDNSESYIIAQDPLPSTIADFWRMVFEQEINTIVMLSELGEGKCPRYWDDDEIQFDHINITYLLSESCPYYTRREFQVTNTKNQDTIRVTQLQYHGWPTVSGQVPEVTRGLIELVGQSGVTTPIGPPILVHCSHGTDRSSMFIALSILTIQLRTEKRVDVSTVTRKLRSQRMGCLDTFLQYEFLHRAIVNYAELHNLLSDS